jgi:hypothetical protein
MVHYKNGQIGVEAQAGDVLELSKKEIDQISSDMRNPEKGMKVLGGRKKAKPADAEG